MAMLEIAPDERWGRLVYLCEAGQDKWGKRQVLCRCDCGEVRVLPLAGLKAGNTRSCGCLRREVTAQQNRASIEAIEPGFRWGRLSYVGEAGCTRHGDRLVRCLCDCGQETNTRLDGLRAGTAQSCGCLRNEVNAERLRTHGMSAVDGGKASPEYRAWGNMIQRCHNPNNAAYHNYGGRGIEVCDRWRNSFKAFLEDMGCRPGPGYSIDRIDVNGNYEPGNCRWATAKVQRANQRTRTPTLFAFKGQLRTLKEWSRETGIAYATLLMRFRMGWSLERAFTTPVRPKAR
jgi:hypothetical protein